MPASATEPGTTPQHGNNTGDEVMELTEMTGLDSIHPNKQKNLSTHNTPPTSNPSLTLQDVMLTNGNGTNGSGAAHSPHSAKTSSSPPAPAATSTSAPTSTSPPAGPDVVTPDGYLDLLRKLKSAWSDQPDLSISWSDLEYKLRIPKTDTSVGTLATALIDAFKKPFQGDSASVEMKALESCSGVIRPASMTLVLAPPGHGKTTLLKALSGRLSHDKALSGRVMFNGLSVDENLKNDVYVNRMCSFVGQQDLLFPTLTVHETLDFASKNSIADPELLRSGSSSSDSAKSSLINDIVDLESRRADLLIGMLGLNECRDTVVGNELLRGVSGGQKKRVTLGEMLLTNSRCYMLDEVSTGLDAAVTLHIFSALKQACHITRASVVTALLQPTPETYALFDDIILLRDGRIVYHGPRDDVPSYMWKVCGLPVPHGVDEAGFVVDYLTDPHQQYVKEETERRAHEQEQGGAKGFAEQGRTIGFAAPSTELNTQQGGVSSSPSLNEARRLSAAVPSNNNKPAPLNTANNQQFASKDSVSPAAGSGAHTPPHVVFHIDDVEDLHYTPPLNAMKKEDDVAVFDLDENGHHRQPSGRLPKLALEEQHQNGVAMKAVSPQAASSSAKPHQLRGGALASSMYASDQAAYHSTVAATPVYSSSDLEDRYKSSEWYARMKDNINDAKKEYKQLDASKWSAYTKASYAQHYPHSFLKHTIMTLTRQWKLIGRNRTMIPPRVAQSIIMGLVIGSLFYQANKTAYSDRMGLLLYSIMYGAFANLTELPVSSEARNVVAKQIDAGFFPTLSYVASVCIMHIPIVLVEVFILGSLVYWMPGFTTDGARYIFFLFIMFLNSNAISVFFRSISYVAKNPDVARQMDLPFIILFVIFAGFLITYDKIPKWLYFVYYTDPFAYAVQALALNEFCSADYDNLAEDTSDSSGISNGRQAREGDIYLKQFGMRTDEKWKWYAVIYLAGFFFLFTLLNIHLLSKLKPITPVGTRKAPAPVISQNGIADGGDQKKAMLKMQTNAHGEVQIEMPAVANAQPHTDDSDAVHELDDSDHTHESRPASPGPAQGNSSVPRGVEQPAAIKSSKRVLGGAKRSFQLTALPFIPVTLAWRNINYSVEIVGKNEEGKKHKYYRQLLNDISGFAAPGRMTALMGSSGAGKTTLMDVIAGRKTVGKLDGEILVNGFPKDKESFEKLTGYVEQTDIHIGTSTVREALLFSAHLRLPSSVSEESRINFVNEVMSLVGLTSIANRLIGDVAIPGLSPGQLKLVTIGVELVANPSVIFLDEPTSGLDAPSAARVMSAVRRIAATGRTVLCTIHQPSEQLFLMFDRLLLLKTGGRDVFFSDCGRKGANLVNYFESASGYTEILPRGSREVLPNGKVKVTLKINPANWMLDVIGAAGQVDHHKQQLDYAQIWRESDLFRKAQQDTQAAAEPKPNAKPIILNEKYVSQYTRFIEVQKRLIVSHWRNSPMNLTRAALMLGMGIILGIIYLGLFPADDFGGVSSVLGVIFLGLSFPSSVIANSPIPSLFRTRAVYYRETVIGLYGFKTFTVTIFFAELPYVVASVFLFLVPFYFLVGLQSSGTLFFKFFLMSLLMCLCYSSLSQLWLALFPNQIILNVVNGLFMSLFFLLGGVLISPKNIPAGWYWFYWVDPVPKAFNGVALSQFYCDTSVADNTCTKITPGPGEAPQYAYDFIVNKLDAHEGDFAALAGWLILEIVILRILCLIALKYVNHIKR